MFTIRDAEIVDIASIVNVHQACFSGQFMTLLGTNGLSAYYRFFIEQPSGIFKVVVTDNLSIIGFVCGWEQGATYQKLLVHQYGNVMVRSLISTAIRYPDRAIFLIPPRLKVLMNFAKQWAFSFPLKCNKTSNIKRSPIQNSCEKINGSLLSIAILPEFRGKNVAMMLNEAFVFDSKLRQVPHISLTVKSDNARARAFYEKAGWQESNHSEKSTQYRMDL